MQMQVQAPVQEVEKNILALRSHFYLHVRTWAMQTQMEK